MRLRIKLDKVDAKIRKRLDEDFKDNAIIKIENDCPDLSTRAGGRYFRDLPVKSRDA